MPLNHTSSYRIVYFMSLDRTSFYSIKRHSIGLYFMSLDRTWFYWIRRHSIGLHISCHWIRRHFIGSNVILSDYISCHWIGRHFIGSDVILSDYILHVTGSNVILLDRTSFYRIMFHVIGSEKLFGRASGFLKKKANTCRVNNNKRTTYSKQYKNGTSWCYEWTGFKCRCWLWRVRYKLEWLYSLVLRLTQSPSQHFAQWKNKVNLKASLK